MPVRVLFAESKLKKPDVIFLFFLVMTCQPIIPLKILSIILVSVLRPVLHLKFGRLFQFYALITILSFISFFFFLFEPNEKYLIVFFFGIIFWLLCLLCFFQIDYFVRVIPFGSRDVTLKCFFAINVVLSLLQLISLIIQFGGNPFIDPSSGDHIVGLFQNSSVNMVVNSFYLLYFLYRKNYGWSILSLLVCLTTTYLSGIILFVAAFVVVLFLSSRISFRLKAIFLISTAVALAVSVSLSPGNLQYATNTIDQISSDSKPRKITAFRQTLEASIRDPIHFLFGYGTGNFSSRLAFTVGGEYTKWFPKELVYRSDIFSKNHFLLWNNDQLSKKYNDGTANQPFSVFNQLLGEYGFIGLVLFLSTYIAYFYRRSQASIYGKMLLASFCLYLTLDYWFEYFNTVIIFETVFLSTFDD